MRHVSFTPARRAVSLECLCASIPLILLLLPGFVYAQGQSASTPQLANGDSAAQPPVLLDAMATELHRAFTSLGHQESGGQLPPYFLSYSVSDASAVLMQSQFGALVSSNQARMRVADVQIRLGNPSLDNTHGNHRAAAITSVHLPLSDDRDALARSLWQATNAGYGRAIENYMQVKTESELHAKEEDSSPDFSHEAQQRYLGTPAPPVAIDRALWEERLRALTKIFRQFPDIYDNVALLTVQNETDYFVSSEETRVVAPHCYARLVVIASTRADDGMDIFRSRSFEAETIDGLPSQSAMEAEMRNLANSLIALRQAPVTEPFHGPAILSGRAAAVFFHEVLGHRLEGQRQRGNEEGQTFTKELGKEVLPSFLSVADDPTIATFGSTRLSGSYLYDDEGQKAQRVDLISNGELKNFLMSRLPIASFASSNGHGRAQTGRMPTGRQGNLIVTSSHAVPEAELRQELIAEVKRQGKSYGLYFEDISSGFAVTQRRSPQAFQVLPLVVWRVYADGRPDELVRGVSIVGTPLAVMKKIIATSDKSDVFNGECGAESGVVPVSAVAPAMLLSEIETQRQPQGTTRPPILPIPGAETGER
jgi:predicted Zn-dependent protease